MSSVSTVSAFRQAAISGYSRVTICIVVVTGLALMMCSAAEACLVPITSDKPHKPCGGTVPCQSSYFELDGWAQRMLVGITAENTPLRRINRFGLFDYGSPTQMLEIFSGADRHGDWAFVNFDSESGLAWIDPEHKVKIGPVFGFYLDSSASSKGGIFYSDALLNTGADFGVSHSKIFDTHGFCKAGAVVAFEDRRVDACGYDADFDDMIVRITNIRPQCAIPEPGTVTLLGLCCGFCLSRRKQPVRVGKAESIRSPV